MLLDASVKYGVKRFHHISTDEVYGSLDLDFKNVFREDYKLNPTNNYSKARVNHDKKYTMDSSKIRSLGWSPKYKFYDGIKEIIK